MPGLVDAHIHAPQYFFAGSNVDLPLLEWLNKYTFPTEHRFRSIDFAEEVYTRVVVSVLLRSVILRSTHALGQIRTGCRGLLTPFIAFVATSPT